MEVALGEKEQVEDAVMSDGSNDVRQTGVDFGEVLTLLMLAKDSEQIDFPSKRNVSRCNNSRNACKC